MQERRTTAAIAALAMLLASCGGEPLKPAPAASVDLTILAINDFHGNLEAPRNDFGGAAWLAAHLRRAEAAAPNSVIVSAGDLIGATPLISSLFHDEPTIEAANLFGLDINGVGNHEFDEGSAELLRMQHGGAHPVDGESPAGRFEGATFQFLAANVVVEDTAETLFPPYAIERFEGIPVAFIGLTLEDTPGVASSFAVQGLSFGDEADTINALVPGLRARGVEAIVVVLHEGGFQDGGEDDCEGLTGPIVGIVERTDPAVDLFVTGHTHRHYLCRVDGRPVTSTGNAGRFFTNISARLDRVSGDMTVTAFDNVPVTRDIEPAADVAALVDRYRQLVAAVSNRIVGEITGDILKAPDAAGESALGGLIADAQLDATRAPQAGGAEIAFMNLGGIRSNLLYASSGSEQDGEVTFAEIFAIHPFGNNLVTLTLTGAQIHTLLEQQWSETPRTVLTPSEGFSYAWSRSRDTGSRVDPASIHLHGEALDPERRYRVTVNSFLAEGGDGFPVLSEGTARVEGPPDVEALRDYLGANSPVTPGEAGRIRVLP